MKIIKICFYIFLTLLIISCESTKKESSQKCQGNNIKLENCLPQSDFRGAWVTNVASDALVSPENIKLTVRNAVKYGINNLFVVVWNKGVTQYPSEVLEKYIGIKQDLNFKGFDPLKLLIEESHKEGIKVHAWFEFGFSFAYDDPESVWIEKYPEWLGRDREGKILKKNNF